MQYASSPAKLTCVAIASLAVFFAISSARADTTTVNVAFDSDIPLNHIHVIYTSNANVKTPPSAFVNTVHLSKDALTLSTSGFVTSATFSVTFTNNYSPAPGEIVTPDYSLQLLALDAAGDIIVGERPSIFFPSGPLTFDVYSTISYADTAAALLADDNTTLASISRYPTGNANVDVLSAEFTQQQSSQIVVGYGLWKFPPGSSSSTAGLDIGTGHFSISPEPASLALLISAASLPLLKRRNKPLRV